MESRERVVEHAGLEPATHDKNASENSAMREVLRAGYRRATTEQRLRWSVERVSTGCLFWVGTRDRDGYGKTKVNRRPWLAHRLSWALHNGPIPDGAVIRHRCDRPACVNPNHLEIGSQADNVRDRDERGRTVVPVRAGGEWTGDHREVG